MRGSSVNHPIFERMFQCFFATIDSLRRCRHVVENRNPSIPAPVRELLEFGVLQVCPNIVAYHRLPPCYNRAGDPEKRFALANRLDYSEQTAYQVVATHRLLITRFSRRDVGVGLEDFLELFVQGKQKAGLFGHRRQARLTMIRR